MFSIGQTKNQLVGLAVTPNLGLEAIVYDKKANEVSKYAQKYLEYNIASREIQSMDAFRSALSDLFNELGLSKEKSSLYVVLPNVYFGFKSSNEEGLSSDAIDSMIESEISESYIFKKAEPVYAKTDVSSSSSSQRYIAFSAIQKNVVEAIQDACSDVGIVPAGIESSTSAIVRGVALTGLANTEIERNQKWDIITINSNNFSIFQVAGTRLIDYIEIPFATMSFDGDDVYPALSDAVAQYLMNYQAEKLVLVSQVDNVEAKILKNSIVFDQDIVALDTNASGTLPYIAISPDVVRQTACSMSLSALGAGCPRVPGFITLNVMGDTAYGGSLSYGTIEKNGKLVDITTEYVYNYIKVVCILIIVLGVLAAGGLFAGSLYYKGLASAQKPKIDSLNSQIEELNKKLDGGTGGLIAGIILNNKTAMNFYDSLSSDIPANVWLNYYYNKSGQNVSIEGSSMDINSIYEYFKSLKILAPQSKIKLNKLAVFREDMEKPESIDSAVLGGGDNQQQIFTFEISNTEYTKLFDTTGNKRSAEEIKNDAKETTPEPDDDKSSKAARIPDVPDVEINLKEVN